MTPLRMSSGTCELRDTYVFSCGQWVKTDHARMIYCSGDGTFLEPWRTAPSFDRALLAITAHATNAPPMSAPFINAPVTICCANASFFSFTIVQMTMPKLLLLPAKKVVLKLAGASKRTNLICKRAQRGSRLDVRSKLQRRVILFSADRKAASRKHSENRCKSCQKRPPLKSLFGLLLKPFAFNLRHQPKAKVVQRTKVALRFATSCDSGSSRNALVQI